MPTDVCAELLKAPAQAAPVQIRDCSITKIILSELVFVFLKGFCTLEISGKARLFHKLRVNFVFQDMSRVQFSSGTTQNTPSSILNQQVIAEIDFELNSEARLTQSQEEDVSQEAQRPHCLKTPESVIRK